MVEYLPTRFYSPIIPPNGFTPTQYLGMFIIGLFLPKFVFDYFFRSHIFLQIHTSSIYWIVSYGIAIAIRGILLLLIKSIQSLMSSIIAILSRIIKFTIWTKSVRKSWRGFKKTYLTPRIPQSTSTVVSLTLCSSVTVVMLWVIYSCWNRAVGEVSSLSYHSFIELIMLLSC